MKTKNINNYKRDFYIDDNKYMIADNFRELKSDDKYIVYYFDKDLDGFVRRFTTNQSILNIKSGMVEYYKDYLSRMSEQ